MDSPNPLSEPTVRTTPSEDAYEVDSLPSELGSPTAKLVMLYLRTTAGATVEEISSDLRLRQLALYPVLDTLTDRGLVLKRGATYRPDETDRGRR